MGIVRWGSVSRTTWQIVAVTVLLAAPTVLPAAPLARADSIEPRAIAITDGEAGREAARAIDKDGGDDRSVRVQLRWERNRETSDFNTGPATIENTIWVANVVSVVYLWGLPHADDTTDWHARYFGGLVVDRIRAAQG